jgi:hypothetical protein
MRTWDAARIVLGVWLIGVVAVFAGGLYAGATGHPNPVFEFVQHNFILNIALGWGSLWLVYQLLSIGERERPVVRGLIALFGVLTFFLPGLPLFWLLGLLGWRGIRRVVTGRGTPARDVEANPRARHADLDHLAGV